MYNKTVGLYHVYPTNRSVLIEALEHKEMNFKCEEIESYAKMKEAKSDVIIIFSPEFMPTRMSVKNIKKTLTKLNKILIIVAYNIPLWKMNRSRTFYVLQRDDRQTLNDVKTILIMEMMGRKDIVLER